MDIQGENGPVLLTFSQKPYIGCVSSSAVWIRVSLVIGRKECPFSTRWKEKLAASAQVSRFVEKMKCINVLVGTMEQTSSLISAQSLYRKDLHCFIIPRSRVSGGDIHLLRG